MRIPAVLGLAATLLFCQYGCGGEKKPTPGGPAGEVKELTGDVKAARAEGDSAARALKVGADVFADDTITTAKGASVTILLAHNERTLTLQEEQKVRLDRSLAWSAPKADKGRALARTDKDLTTAAGRHTEREAAETRPTPTAEPKTEETVEPPPAPQAGGVIGEGNIGSQGAGVGGGGTSSGGIGSAGTIGSGSGKGTGFGSGPKRDDRSGKKSGPGGGRNDTRSGSGASSGSSDRPAKTKRETGGDGGARTRGNQDEGSVFAGEEVDDEVEEVEDEVERGDDSPADLRRLVLRCGARSGITEAVEISVRVRLNASGAVTGVSIRSGSKLPPAFESCVKKGANRLRFRDGVSTPVTIKVKISG